MADPATVQTSTATSSAQGAPTAPGEAKVTEPKVTAPPAPSKPESAPEAAKETKDTAKPAPEAPKAEVKAEAKQEEKKEPAKAEPSKEVVYDIKLPEGSKVSKENIETLTAYAKEAGLSNEAANTLAAFVDANQKAVERQVNVEWLEECKKNPKWGGDKLPATMENNKRFLERVHPEAQKLLDQSGYANNPVVFDFISLLADQAKGDSLVSGKQAVSEDSRSTHQKIADHYNKEMGVTR